MNKEIEKNIESIEEKLSELCEPYGFKAFIMRDYRFLTLKNGKIDYVEDDQNDPNYGFRVILEGPSMSSRKELTSEDYKKSIELSEEIKKNFKEVATVSITTAKK